MKQQSYCFIRQRDCCFLLQFALENDIRIRFHTLVWHSQTPKWFFTEDYTDKMPNLSRNVVKETPNL